MMIIILSVWIALTLTGSLLMIIGCQKNLDKAVLFVTGALISLIAVLYPLVCLTIFISTRIVGRVCLISLIVFLFGIGLIIVGVIDDNAAKGQDEELFHEEKIYLAAILFLLIGICPVTTILCCCCCDNRNWLYYGIDSKGAHTYVFNWQRWYWGPWE